MRKFIMGIATLIAIFLTSCASCSTTEVEYGFKNEADSSLALEFSMNVEALEINAYMDYIEDIVFCPEDSSIIVEYWDYDAFDMYTMMDNGYQFADTNYPCIRCYLNPLDLDALTECERVYWKSDPNGAVREAINNNWCILQSEDGKYFQFARRFFE